MLRATFWVVLLNGLLVAVLLALFRFLQPPMLGQAIAWTVMLFNIVLPIAAWLRSQHELLDAWLFLLPLSICQVMPDWIAATLLGALTFPPLGGGYFGPVPAYFAGLWVAPLLIVLWLSEIVHRKSALLGVFTAAAVSLAVFAACEFFAPKFGLWLPRNVQTYQGIALYVLPAEVALGLATWLMFVLVQGRAIVVKVAGADAVSTFYAGALTVSFFMIERL
jgi:hypothetical protein